MSHLEIIDSDRAILLRTIASKIHLNEYYMAGGTALSLQTGWRESYDFDFFVPKEFNTENLHLQLVTQIGKTRILNITTGTCDVSINGVQVTFFHYPNTMLKPYVSDNDFPGLNMASIDDIAAMKAVAIGGRGAKKDFFDLYQILQNTDFSAKDLVEGLYIKFGTNRDFSYIGMGLNYFDDADSEKLPETMVDYNWEEIKTYFSKFQNEFFEELNKIDIVDIQKRRERRI
ncbi:MAG: nucleotidyl transferase AbiEii/AbiGii toxin family protein [Clostridiales bacterium]|nr:nucleotidyl transferase AbiEii/AbiGii toxin family protein [Clostridiales bacterium]